MPLPEGEQNLLKSIRENGLNRILFLGAVILMLAGAAFLKLPALRNGAPNLEAPYHVLLTVSSLNETPVARHHLLPTVSLGSVYDKNISWGATLRLPSGDYVYTSFASPGFLAPFAFFKLTDLRITLRNLMMFNFFLQAVAVLALATLLKSVTRSYADRRQRSLAILAGVSVQIFSSEALLSYGIIYWPQQVYQIILICSLICVTHIIQRDGRRCSVLIAALAALCFVGPWTEWTGFVFNAGSVMFFGWKGRSDRRYIWIAATIAGATAATIILLVGQYAAYVGLLPTLKAFAKRFLVRSVSHSGPLDLLRGYLLSFGLLIPLAVVAIAYVWRTARRVPSSPAVGMGLLILALSAIPLFENVLMMQHASQFSFDRLKMAVPIAIGLTMAMALVNVRWRLIGAVLLMGALVQNVVIYRARLADHVSWQGIDRNNRLLRDKIDALIDRDCAVLTSHLTVRGYANLLFHRGIFESVSSEAFDHYAASPRAVRCGAVHLEGSTPFPDMPHYSGATVRRGGRTWQVSI
ncbi:MAG TPA: hypothetical protein VF637_02845 [Sphingomicrobium sp.]|jgi:hypothetical protein